MAKALFNDTENLTVLYEPAEVGLLICVCLYAVRMPMPELTVQHV